MKILLAMLACTSSLLAQTADPVLTYAGDVPTTQPRSRAHAGASWSSAGVVGTLASTATFQLLASCHARDEVAGLFLNDTRALYVGTQVAGAWGTPTLLTSDTGIASSRVFAGAYEGNAATFLTAYRRSTSSTGVYYRHYASASPAEQFLNLSLAAAPTHLELVARPGSNDVVLLATSGSTLTAAVWDGSAWGTPTTLESSLATSGCPRVAVPVLGSRSVMVLWGPSTGSVKYRLWDGASWSAAASIALGGADVRWLAAAASPATGSERVIVAAMDTSNDLRTATWNGTAWGSVTTHETSASSSTARRVDVAWQPDGAKAVLAWHAAGASTLKYRSWDGSSWSSTSTSASLGSQATGVYLAPGDSDTHVVLAARRAGVAVWTDYVMYSDTGSVSPGGSTVIGNSGQNVSGVDLPTPPAATAGSSNVSVGNNGTISIAPGNYAALSTGQSSTVNFTTAGTYVFTQYVTSSNTVTFNFNTTSGDIALILTSGSFDAKNTMTLNRSGTGKVRLHVKNGNFGVNNNLTANGIEVFVYNGKFEAKNDVNFAGAIYATGNVSVGSGTVSLGSDIATGPGRLAAAHFVSGSLQSLGDVCSALAGDSLKEPLALVGSPMPLAGASLRVVRWRETSDEE